jgi:hypothetical protein
VTVRRGRRRKQLLDELKEKEDTENWKRKDYIVICGEVALEKSMDRS